MTDVRPTTHPANNEHHQRQARRAAWGWWFFAAVALFYLLTEHQAHLFGALPLLLLLACPLMHLFMHHGHGRHRNRDTHSDAAPRQEDNK